MVFAYELGNFLGYHLALGFHHFRAHALGEAHIVGEGMLVLVAFIRPGVDVQHIKIAVQRLGHARAACDQVLGSGI